VHKLFKGHGAKLNVSQSMCSTEDVNHIYLNIFLVKLHFLFRRDFLSPGFSLFIYPWATQAGLETESILHSASLGFSSSDFKFIIHFYTERNVHIILIAVWSHLEKSQIWSETLDTYFTNLHLTEW